MESQLAVLIAWILIGTASADRSCDRQIQVSIGSTGLITSPNYPDPYPSNSDCTYRLIVTGSAGTMTLSFPSFNVEAHRNCQFDYVAIYDGPSTSSRQLGRFCGEGEKASLSGTGKYLTIHFHSDSSVVGDGFSISYTVGCSHEYSTNEGHFTSPGYPASYHDSTECTYTIHPDTGSQVLLEFQQFDVEESNSCNFDYLSLLSPDQRGAPIKYCGNKDGLKKLVNASRLEFTFHSDASVARPGFYMNYRMTTDCTYENGGCEQFCTPISPGKVLCSCNEGFTLDENSVHCVDINECDRGTSGCEDECVNTLGSFSCRCSRSGYQLSPDNRTCTDMTCKIRNGGCAHICQPYGDAQYSCACNPGYLISEDAHNCTDINECNTTDTNYQHHCEQVCVNEPGSYYCDCNEGFQISPNRRTCNDMVDCPQHEHKCSHLCRDVPGSWECTCYEGYQVDPSDLSDCMDVDECATGVYPDTCAVCTNFEGSYECVCKSGYEPNDDNTNCTDVDECRDNNGGCEQLCLNTPGSYRCSCRNGYTSPDNSSDVCNDINECLPNDLRGPCDHFCENFDGSFKCHCLGGYNLLSDQITCQDINECENGKNGDCEQKCVNTAGSHHCVCFPGFEEINGTCIDIDECERNLCDSSVETTCSNSIGSFSCKCPSGYTTVNTTVCQDNDECEKDKHGCSQVCQNIPGSYRCLCQVGYVADSNDDKQCLDVNECTRSDLCQQQCYNLIGSFRCDCDPGFYLLGNGRNCSDLNECAEALDNCQQICVNEIGYHRCECRPGFVLNSDNSTCADINECTTGSSGCSDGCVNLAGSYLCYCDPGYELQSDNHTCQDVNECLDKNGRCQHICNNFNGSFSCGCLDGYSFNGTTGCDDIDECATANGNCSQQCVNNEGAYECQCEPNFKLSNDSLTCEHCPTCVEFKQISDDVTELKQLVKTIEQLTVSNLRLSAIVVDLQERVVGLEASVRSSAGGPK